VKPGILEKGILLRMRFEMEQYINLRPVRLYDDRFCPIKDKKPEDIDFVVVRENNEGLYTGSGGFTFKARPTRLPSRKASTPAGESSAASAMPSNTPASVEAASPGKG